MKNKGFTMIELVVAIAIMGIIMILAIPSVKYIQAANRDKKFVAYEKAISMASKAYTDAYSEDMFGSTNTGCAIVTYADLKEKDLIDDIQLRNTDCGRQDTFIYVRRNKNGNYNYDPYVTCRENNKIVYGPGKKPNELKQCELEDGKGPVLTIKDISGFGFPYYYVGEQPNLKVTITDVGVGLKANQTVSYQWKKNGKPINGYSGFINFNNKNYEPTKTKGVTNPPNMDNLTDNTIYTLELDGTIEDVDNNKTSRNDNWKYKVEYYVGHVLIKMHANGGKLINGNHYYLDNSGNVVHSGDNNLYIHRIPYRGSLGSTGLLNCNNPDWLNVGKTGYHPVDKKEWNTKPDGTGTSYNQNFDYTDLDFYNNVRKTDHTVDLYINWEINTYTLRYDPNGGSGCSDKTKKQTHGSKWGTLCTPARPGYTFTGWKVGSEPVDKDTVATNDVTLVAQWSANVCTITYNANGGSFNSDRDKTVQKCEYGKNCNLRDATSSGFKSSRTGYHVESGNAWKNGSTTYTQVGNTYKAEDICSNLGDDNSAKTLYVNWHTNVCTLNFDPNGGSFGEHNNSSDKKQTCNYNSSCNLRDASGHYKARKAGYYIDASNAWTDGTSTYTQIGSSYTALSLCGDDLKTGNVSKTMKVNWIGNVCTITYDPNGGEFGAYSNATTQTCHYGSYCDLRDATSGHYSASKDWYHVDSAAKAWRNNGKFYTQINGNLKTEKICDDLDKGNKSKTLYVNWDENRLYLEYYTNGGHLSASADQACPLSIPREYRDGCSRSSNYDGCTGDRSGLVFRSAGAVRTSDGFSSKGLRDYSSGHSADGVHWNLFMRYTNHSATGKWHVGSSTASKKISENTTFSTVEAFANEINRKNEFKHSDITVKLYAEWN